MKHLVILAVVLASAVARPELYKENEDFQFSRSSSDDGSKSGYYGAQRGNMGGNYERAHNMDSLAQNQMGGLVRQVEGELGDGSNTRTGSVYSAANSRGVYGSGRYDLSNLEGRNFQESETTGNSQSHSSLSSMNSGYNGQASSALHSAGYNSNQAQDSRYQSTKNSAHASHASNQQAAQSAHASDAYDYNRQSGYNSGYHSQSGYQSAYTNQHGADVYGSNPRTRVISGAPARVVIRPGSTVIVPIAAQTYDSGHSASVYDQNAINTDAEELSNNNHHDTSFRPSTNPKHYESSYNYRREWEKHSDTHTAPSAVPLAVPTQNPLPRNSELYDDTRSSDSQYQASGSDSHNRYSGYHSNVKSAASSQSQHQSDYNSQRSSSSAGSNSNAYTNGVYSSGAAADATNALGDGSGKPKSYQSSYSYHKSWERQGDPYVIYPDAGTVTDGQASQRLTDASNNQQHYSSHNYGSNNQNGHQSHSYGTADECDEHGHRRVARSYNTAQNQEYNPYQQSQIHEDKEDSGQQAQSERGRFEQGQSLEYFGQRSQNLEELGQQTQDLGQSHNFEDLGQKTQDLGQSQNLEDLGQQTQDLGQSQNMEYLGQQTQNLHDLRQYNQNLENLKQQSQNKWDRLEVDGQQTQNQWDNLEELRQHTQTDLGQHTQDTWNKEANIGKTEKLGDLGQQTQNQWENPEELGQQVQNPWNPQQDQKIQNRSHNDQDIFLKEQVTQSDSDKLHSFNQQSQTSQKESVDAYQMQHHNGADSFESQNTNNESQFTIRGENFDQQANWHQIFQKESTDFDQQSQDSLSKLGTVNQDNRVNVSDEVQTVWKQVEDNNTQQVSQHTSSDIFNNNRFGNQGGYFTEQNRDSSNQQIETTNGNEQWNTNEFNTQNEKHEQDNLTYNNISQSISVGTGRTSLQSLWDKINNFDQVSSTSTNKHDNNKIENYFSHGYRNSQNSNFSQSFQHNQFEFGDAVNQPSQSTLSSEVKSTSSTVKSETEQTLTHNTENLRTQDIGRGDIGPEDTPMTITTEKSYTVIETKPNKKHNKTPEEIDALSQTKESNTTTSNQQGTNEEQNTQQSDNTLSVLSLNQQRWLEEQKLHEGNQRNSVHLSDTSNKNYSNNITNEKKASQQFDKQSQSTFYYNKPNNRIVNHKPVTPVSDSQYKPDDQINNNQNDVSFEQAPDEIEQQNTEQQFEDLGQFGQQSENLGQQSQTIWGKNLDEFRQEQTAWRPHEETQQSNTQQFENLGRSNQNQFQGTDFYNQRYHIVQQQRNQKIENLQMVPESKKDEGIQLVSHKNRDIEIVPPIEPSTGKPGFWKSVGSKFTNAKDKVASWFKS